MLLIINDIVAFKSTKTFLTAIKIASLSSQYIFCNEKRIYTKLDRSIQRSTTTKEIIFTDEMSSLSPNEKYQQYVVEKVNCE